MKPSEKIKEIMENGDDSVGVIESIIIYLDEKDKQENGTK